MDLDTLTAWCHSLAKAYSTGVRLYRGAELLVYRSVYPLHPDPAGPYLPRILECGAEVGIITTPVYQFYGFLTVKPGLRVILGPTRFLRGDGRELDELMALLAVPVEEWAGYAQVLRSAPVISAHRLAWLLCSLTTALRGRPFPVEQVWLDTRMEDVRSSVHADHTRQRLEVMTDPSAIERLAQDMMIDYAQRVKRLRGPGKGQDRFYRLCAQICYHDTISQNWERSGNV